MLDLHTLNREQLEAVLTTEGPLLVLAGAGSGKTRVITYRLAQLIENGVSPKSILCVTFTNKAAFEMRERARKLVGKSVRGTTISTFHALGSKILREYAARIGLRPNFTISDGGEQIGSMRRILRGLRIDDRRFDPKQIMAMISRAKNAGLDARRFRDLGGEIPSAAPGPDDELPDEEYRVATIEAYQRYEESLRAQNVVDFDDLLLLTAKLLAENADVLAMLQRRWRYLQIDEYQDTNGAQFDLMRMVSGAARNLCVVGDDDQSIYGWRGADVEKILRFEEHFPGARVVKLETNYRSSGNILAVANAIIEKNSKRHGKRLRPATGAGAPVRIVAVEDEDAEADQVANAILALTAANVAPKDISVLFRSNVQSRALELALRRVGVPYRVVGGMELFDKKEIKDALAYLKLLDNPEDEQSLRRIVNFPPRGIGDTSLERIDAFARDHGQTLVEGLRRVSEVPALTAKVVDAVEAFLHTIDAHRVLLGRRKVSTVAKKLLESIKLEDTLFGSSDSGQTALRRVENVREVVRQIERYETRIKKGAKRRGAEEDAEPTVEADEDDDAGLPLEDLEATLSGFLADLALGSWEDGSSRDDRNDQVVLSTIHASKGLEWLHVFVVGAEEEFLPHARTMEGDGDVEEERRLAYVAVTRAQRHLTLSWAMNRSKWGRLVQRQRSRFLEALPEEAISVTEGEVKAPRTEEEKDVIAKNWMAKIRSQLGME